MLYSVKKCKPAVILMLVIGMMLTTWAVRPVNVHAASSEPYVPNIDYEIDAALDTDDMRITGKQKVTYRNTSQDTLNEIGLHLYANANRRIDTQQLRKRTQQIAEKHPDKKPSDYLGGIYLFNIKETGSQQYLKYSRQLEDQSVLIPLPSPLAPNQSVTLEIEFTTKIPYGMSRLSNYKDIINGAHWYPVVANYDEETHSWNQGSYSLFGESEYLESSNYKVKLNVPTDWKVAMPGTMKEENLNIGRKLVTAVAASTRELVLFASPHFEIATKTKDGLTLYYYYQNETQSSQKEKLVEAYLEEAFDVIAFFNEKFGAYPYPDLRFIETELTDAGLEFSRLIQMSKIEEGEEPSINLTFVHEIAHQWFHAIIGNDSDTEACLDESFAEFAAAYYFDHKGDVVLGLDSLRMKGEISLDMKLPIHSTNEEAGSQQNYLLNYIFGPIAIFELYQSVGEAQFDRMMQEYFNRYAYRNATVEGLLNTIQDTLGTEARHLMDKNLNEPHYKLNPDYLMTPEEMEIYNEAFVAR